MQFGGSVVDEDDPAISVRHDDALDELAEDRGTLRSERLGRGACAGDRGGGNIALGEIHEGARRALQCALIDDRAHPVFDREAGAVEAEEELAVYVLLLA